MSMCVLGHAAEFNQYGIAVNALWPRTVIQTAALQMIPGIKPEHCRKPDIMADAAYQVLISDAKTTTGNFFIDDEVLKTAGITDLSKYSVVPGSRELVPDLFL
jgi:citronellol/citronellal dehydrogenase